MINYPRLAALSRLVGCVAGLLLATLNTCEADEVVYYSARLPIDQREPLSGDLLKISLGDEVFIVSEAEAGRRVAIRLLSRDGLRDRLSDALARQIADEAYRAEDQDVLYPALVFALRSARPDSDNELDNWKPFAGSELGRRCLVNALLDSISPEVSQLRLCEATRALSGVTREDSSVVVPGLSDVVTRVGDICVREALGVSERELYGSADIPSVISRLTESSTGFIAVGSVLESEVARVNGAMRGLQEAIDATRLDLFNQSLVGVAEAFRKSASEQNDTKLCERFMLKALERGDPALVLKLLAERPFERRNTETHRLLLRATRELKGSVAQSVLEDSNLHGVLIRYALKDEEIRSHYGDLAGRVVADALAAGDIERGYEVLRVARDQSAVAGAKLAELYGARGVRLSADLISGFLGRGEYARALQVADELKQGSWPVLLSLRLALARVRIGLLTLLAIVLGSLALLYRRYGFKRGAKDEPEEVRVSASSPVSGKAKTQPEPEVVNAKPLFSPDYVDALAFFGLEPGATLAQIKNAYRTLVKENHPDAKPNATDEDHTRFIKITSEYERLLDLHEREGLMQ